MVITSVLLISAFTAIQLNNQLEYLIQRNAYQANLSSIVAKNNLELALKKTKPDAFAQSLQASLDTLMETSILQEAVIFDKDGLILASTLRDRIGKNVRYKDLERWDAAEKEAGNRWFTSDIDRLSRQLNIFVPLRRSVKEPILYLSKISFSLGNIQEAFSGVYRAVFLTSLLIILANIALGYFLSKTVIGPIKVLNHITKIIAAGDLNIRARIETNDELEELGLTFNYMTEELIKMKERAENANPLTKLPGNIVIREEIEKKIVQGLKFVVVYSDLDNFKSFNDKYGIGKGDEAIKLTADIMREAIANMGNPNDFLGHEGGDDFILLTTPSVHQQVTDYIIKEFDRRVRDLYSAEDLALGHIIAHARDGSVKQFPIMGISLAGVTNEHRTIASYGEVTNIAAEIKKHAKSLEGSVFVLDRRHT